MLNKSSLLVFLVIFCSISLAACVSAATDRPSPEQHTLETGVAATMQAALTATQAALAGTRVSPAVTLTPPPTTTETATGTHTSTVSPSPTPEPTVSAIIRLAFIKDGNVWLWIGGKDTIQLTDTHDTVDLRISDDGQLIAFKRQDPDNVNSQALWVINTDDSDEERVLISATDLAAIMPPDPDSYITGVGILSFVWRPNTHEVAYNTLILHEGPGFGPNYDLRIVNADSLVKTTLLDIQQGGMFYYSPDGNQVALSNPDSISLINADGTNLRQDVLTFPIVGTHSEYLYCPHPIWASDSRSLRVAIPPEETLASPLPPTGLWSLPVDGSPAVLLGNIQAIPFAWPDHAFAPDLSHVIYVMYAEGQIENQRELHIANPDGSNDTVYDRGESLEFTSWSPDSQHFIYLIDGGENQGLYLGALAGTPEQVTLLPRLMSNIQWLDGSRFAYLLWNGSQWELRIRNLSGEDLAFIDTITDSYPAYDVQP